MTQAWVSHRLNLIAVSPTVCQPPINWPSSHRVAGFLAVTEATQETIPEEVHACEGAGDHSRPTRLASRHRA
jgi:hypothetical protein